MKTHGFNKQEWKKKKKKEKREEKNVSFSWKALRWGRCQREKQGRRGGHQIPTECQRWSRVESSGSWQQHVITQGKYSVRRTALCFCQTGHNSCTFKSVKLPASIQISKHLLLQKHLKKPHTSYSSFLLITSKAVSCNKTPSDISASFLTCQKKTFSWLCLHCKEFFFHFVLWGKQRRWGW